MMEVSDVRIMFLFLKPQETSLNEIDLINE